MNSLVESQMVELAVHVDRIRLSQSDQLLQCLIDEDNTDQRGKGFLSKARDVAHQGAGVSRHEDDA